ncbi:hypothetical protein FC24_GL001862 [Loigolactobacillus rennini DSM 20253]|uniref:Uncharacterized protein n=1 Tax=Loigolactobacillus rennini DSM 20253 TaxID=1423796 RepID=A0A0R2CXM7_9LACO|nr:hypothetical protein FC24_GL001862 [Loigolactobacillus rennini DSM 20253]
MLANHIFVYTGKVLVCFEGGYYAKKKNKLAELTYYWCFIIVAFYLSVTVWF